MAEERPGGEYDWLFDPASKPGKQTVTPTAPPPTSTLPPPVLPKPTGNVRRPGIARRGRWIAIGVIAVPLVWLTYLIAVPFMAWSTVSTVHAWPDGARPADQPGTTYLIVGSDSRKGLSSDEQKALKTGKDEGGRGRTDTIMLLHAGAGRPLLVSIPRDSIVPIPGYSTTKINAAYAFGGPELLVQTLEQNTGVHIDRYAEIGFGGVVNLVDAVGGVKICPKEAATDKDSGLNIKAGCQIADGKTALAYSRTRHAYASGDIQRVQNQREVIGGLGAKLRQPATVLDPLRYFEVVNGGAAAVSVDDDATIPEMAKFAMALSDAMGSKGQNCNVPISDLAVHWDSVRAPEFFEHVRTDTTEELGDLCTKDGLPPS